MLILFLFFSISSITLENYAMLVDIIFESKKQFSISLENCPQKQSQNFYYKGRPEDFSNIKNKYDSYSSVYLPDGHTYNIDTFKKFPKSTIFLTKDNNLKLDDYCFITIGDSYFILSSNYYFIIIGQLKNVFEYYLYFFLVVLSIFMFIIFFLYTTCTNAQYLKLYVSRFTFLYLNFSPLLSFSCLLIYFISNIFSIAHSIYKAFIIIQLIYLLSGYKVLYSPPNGRKKIKYTIILFFIELITSMIFYFIIYLIPSLDNFYLYFIKSLIEHLTILVTLIKMF